MISALRRLPEVPGLVAQKGCFVVHAPRQTGKTTAIRALAAELTASGRYAALAFSCEIGRAAGDNYGGAQRDILDEIRSGAKFDLPAQLRPPPWPEAPDGGLLKAALTAWAQACPNPSVRPRLPGNTSQLVFTAPRSDGDRELYVMKDIDKPDQIQQLTNHGGNDTRPRWNSG